MKKPTTYTVGYNFYGNDCINHFVQREINLKHRIPQFKKAFMNGFHEKVCCLVF